MQRAFQGLLRDLAPTPAAADDASQTPGTMEREALRHAAENKKRTAEALGIHRSALYAKLKRLGVAP